MPILDLSSDEPIAHRQHGNESHCPFCAYVTQHPIAFLQHMIVQHNRRFNRVTKLWEKVKNG